MVFIDGIVFSLQNSGGISVYFAEILNRLFVRDFYLLMGNNDNKVLREFQGKEVYDKHFPSLSVARYMDLDLVEGASVFHSSYYRLPKKKYRNSVKVITTVHDFTYEKYIGGWKSLIHTWQKRRAVMNSDVVVCISESTRNDLLAYIPESNEKDIRVIYNGVSDDYYPVDGSDKKLCCSNDYILFVGARSNYKNFTLLVESLINLKNFHLVIAGGGGLTNEERCFLDESVPGRYVYKSFVENTVLNQLYNNAFCLVYPSLYEGFGIPVLEAMKAGCPVIAVNGSSLTEVCGEAAILLDEVTPSSIGKAIYMLSDPSFRDTIIKLGIENASLFSWDKSFSEIDAVYDELLK